MSTRTIASWSNVRPSQTSLEPFTPDRWLHALRGKSAVIPRGAGRSFSDAAYVHDGQTLHSLEHRGEPELDGDVVRCSSGVQIGDLQDWLARHGRRFAVYGGTQWATIGGAVASDIHGKNHPVAGSFGQHVRELELLTASGDRIRCSRAIEPDVFGATIGGMGLTGFVTEVELELDPASPGAVETRWSSIDGVDGIVELFAAKDDAYRFCAIVNLCADRVRGIFCSGRPSPAAPQRARRPWKIPVPRAPIITPRFLKLLEAFMNGPARPRDAIIHEREVNYAGEHYFPRPNRFYGVRGFIEFQFTLPPAAFKVALALARSGARERGLLLCFAVIKAMGPQPRAGLLSFPSDGLTINFQVENNPSARDFLDRLTDEVVDRGSRLYLAKDSIARPAQFAGACPELASWQQIARRLDPEGLIQSELSRRLELKNWGSVRALAGARPRQ